jgi:hypothetical protein
MLKLMLTGCEAASTKKLRMFGILSPAIGGQPWVSFRQWMLVQVNLVTFEVCDTLVSQTWPMEAWAPRHRETSAVFDLCFELLSQPSTRPLFMVGLPIGHSHVAKNRWALVGKVAAQMLFPHSWTKLQVAGHWAVRPVCFGLNCSLVGNQSWAPVTSRGQEPRTADRAHLGRGKFQNDDPFLAAPLARHFRLTRTSAAEPLLRLEAGQLHRQHQRQRCTPSR